MSTMQENQESNCKLAQYYYNFYHSDDVLAKRIFLEERNINYKLSAVENSELIGCTALHFAAKRQSTCDIEFLLSHGADPMIKNQNGLTPLYFVVKGNCKHIDDFFKVKSECKLLLSAQMRSGNLENPTDRNGLSHFHVACMADDAEAVELFLKSGVSVDVTINLDSPHFPGFTPLHLTARYSALQAMKLLLKYEANTQLKNAKGVTFLYTLLEIRAAIIEPLSIYYEEFSESTKDANLEVMNFLLQNDSYTIDYVGLTNFHLACFVLESLVAKRLLQKITDINHAVDVGAPHWPGYTALHFAAHSSIEMVKMLVKNGANLLVEDAKGVTPLDICIRKFGVEDVHAVLSLDANWRSVLMSDRRTRLLSLIFAMKDVNQFDNFLEPRPQIVNTFVPGDSPAWQGFTPLHIAVMFFETHNSLFEKDERSEHIIEKLMAGGANINAQDSRGRSPIHLAFRQLFGNIQGRITTFLLKFDEKIEEAVDEDNLSHLHIACKMRDKKSVEKILLTYFDVDIAFKGQSNVHQISVGSTPLHCAACDDEIVNLLLLHGADPFLKDANGMTAIHHSTGYSDALLSVLDLKDSVVTDTGLSHLHIASFRGDVDAAEKLLDLGADVNQALLQDDVLSCIGLTLGDKAGDTPLDFALSEEIDEMVELLLQRGAEILVEEPTAVVDTEASDILKRFVSPLNHDDNLFKRLEKEIGLTMLHVACSRKDVDLIKGLLVSGADVNAQINVKSRLWPAYTPLHIVMDDDSDDNNLEEVVRLLLDNGSDITMTTFAAQKTALYLAYDRIRKDLPSNRYSCMKMILRAHKDFMVNPTRPDGLSHFHVACSIGDVITAEKFLKHGADVNQPTDYFEGYSALRGRSTAGCTPLLLAASSGERAVDPVSQLEIVDLLLNYGADVNAQDISGNTSLHYIAMTRCSHKREDVILRMIKSEADANSRNIQGQTPLELLMETKQSVTVDDIRCLLKFGCLFNVFNPVTDKGLLAIALTLISSEDLVYLIRSLMINFPRLIQIHEIGRTIIHNIFTNTNFIAKSLFRQHKPVISDSQYIRLIKELDKLGYDVDDQDKLGRTPLHLAVLFRNIEAISALLMAGTDVNVTDATGKTAFSYIFQCCIECPIVKKHNHFEVFSIFVMHMKKLLVCGLDISQTNENLMLEAFEKFNSKDMSVPELFKNQINEIRNLNIARSKLTVGNFLSETDAVVAYPTLPQTNRDAVDEFFKNDIWDFCTKYSQAAGILFLQYRKAVKRIDLIESAQSALNSLSRFPMPDLCSTAILKFLSNSELNNIIEATS